MTAFSCRSIRIHQSLEESKALMTYYLTSNNTVCSHFQFSNRPRSALVAKTNLTINFISTAQIIIFSVRLIL